MLALQCVVLDIGKDGLGLDLIALLELGRRLFPLFWEVDSPASFKTTSFWTGNFSSRRVPTLRRFKSTVPAFVIRATSSLTSPDAGTASSALSGVDRLSCPRP